MSIITNISFIKDPRNPILSQRAQLPPTIIYVYLETLSILVYSERPSVLVYFEGYSVIDEHIDSPNIGLDIEIGEKGAEPKIVIGGEGALTTSMSALTSIPEPTKASTFPPHPRISIWLMCYVSFFSTWFIGRMR